MAVRTSTGFEALIFGSRSFESIFENGCIEVRSGPQPDSADLPPTGELLARITRDGEAWEPGSSEGGLRFSRSGRYVMKNPADIWRLKGLASGVVGWFRLLPNQEDTGLLSVTAPRIDGLMGVLPEAGETFTDTQIFLPTTSITSSTTIDINYWWLAKPPLGE